MVDPVGVKDAKIGTAEADTLFGGGLEGALVLELVDTLIGGLAVGSALWRRPLATTSANSHTVDHITLFSLVTETASLVWSGWAGSTVDDMKLSKLPATDSEKES